MIDFITDVIIPNLVLQLQTGMVMAIVILPLVALFVFALNRVWRKQQ